MPPISLQDVSSGTYYQYKGKQYTVLGFPNVKDASDGNWYEGVLYMPRNDPLPGDYTNTFCRRLDDFAAKFEPAEQ